MIYPCPGRDCKSAFQDDLYGRGRRVFNECNGPLHEYTYGRCSVCKTETTVGKKSQPKVEEKNDERPNAEGSSKASSK